MIVARAQQHVSESLAVISGSTAFISFFSQTLPIVQWLAALVAIAAGIVAILWTGYKFAMLRKQNAKVTEKRPAAE